MDASSVSLSAVLVEFEDLPNEICNNKDVRCHYKITGDYAPHSLDKIHLCPIDYTSDFQELNTWEFVTCHKTGNEIFPYEGKVVFSCEKYGFLVLDHANASGYTLKYVNKDGIVLGETNIFSIVLEELESATMGISYVFLPNELNDSPIQPDDTVLEVPEQTLVEETVSLEEGPKAPLECSVEETSLNLSEPGNSLFPLNMHQDESNRLIRTEEQVAFLEDTVRDLKEQHQELEERYDTKVLECEQLSETKEFLIEQRGRYEDAHKEAFQILTEGMAKLDEILIPDSRVMFDTEAMATGLTVGTDDLTVVWEQISKLLEAAAAQKSENENVRSENEKLKTECKNLQAVAHDYKNQLILTSQEQAQISDKMIQLGKDKDFMKALEMPDKSPDRTSRTIMYPPTARPKHVAFTESTQSIVMTDPAKGKSNSTFTSLKFLQACSVHEDAVSCPICQKAFEPAESSVARTKHVNRCMEKSKEKPK